MMHTRFVKQKGLTLIELMIALVLGLLLAAGALMMFMGNKETSIFQEQFARVQESGRFATDILMREIRPAGYWGCGSQNPVVTNTLSVGTGIDDFDFSRGVYGYESKADASGWENNTDGGTPVSAVTAQAVAGTDVLMIKTIQGSSCRVTKHTGASVSKTSGGSCACSRIKCNGPVAASMEFSEVCGLADDDVVMVSDCVDAAIFQLTNVSSSSGVTKVVHNTGTGTIGNCTKQLGKLYVGGSLMKMYSYIFMIRNNASGIPSLYRYKNGVAEELVEGVEDMQLSYGEDTTGVGAVDVYRTADQVTDWDNVYSVRLDLLVRSFNTNVADAAQNIGIDKNGDGDTDDTSYTETVDTSDLRIRQVFSTTVVVRNRVS